MLGCITKVSLLCHALTPPRSLASSQILDIAKERLEAGDAPTEDAEREWERMQRRRDMREEIVYRKQEELRQVTSDLETTAVPRPNAYMPEDIALPRPYGAMAPFKPSEPGATMRHIVKPQPREIEI